MPNEITRFYLIISEEMNEARYSGTWFIYIDESYMWDKQDYNTGDGETSKNTIIIFNIIQLSVAKYRI